MRRSSIWVIALAVILTAPRPAAAGGTEFPADGARNLGRGGTGFTRADDPHLMLRNPALLADLWDDVAMAGAHFLIADSCFRATGGYGWNYGSTPDVSDFGDGPVYIQDPENGYMDEPYPEVCFQGPMPILPSIALAKKLSSNLGVGLGFFPPDTAMLPQWGDRDGTVATPNGRRPTPTRYFRSHLNTTYFSALGAVGYRPADFIRIGFGFQWTLVVFDSSNWAQATRNISPRNDVSSVAKGQDLFIPGLIASAHIVPTDSLDVAVGFKWADRLRASADLDITTGAFGAGAEGPFMASNGTLLPSNVPNTTRGIRGEVDAPPVWVPQLSVGVRYADRIVPRVRDHKAAREAAGREVVDHMSTERWDIEAVAVVYFNSANDQQIFRNLSGRSKRLELITRNIDGSLSRMPGDVGECTKVDSTGNCVGNWEVPLDFGGREQLSLRLGGDYNIVPGVFSVRAGVSHETSGIDPSYLNVTNYMMGRTGIHAGLTVRIAGKTDLSLAFAHFIHPSVRLQVNEKSTFPRRYYMNAQGEFDAELAKKYNYVPGEHDGTAKFEVPYGDDFGPNFVNAGSFFYHLSVVSISLAQHF